MARVSLAQVCPGCYKMKKLGAWVDNSELLVKSLVKTALKANYQFILIETEKCPDCKRKK